MLQHGGCLDIRRGASVLPHVRYIKHQTHAYVLDDYTTNSVAALSAT